MEPDAARWPRSLAAGLVPCIESRSRPPPPLEAADRVDEVTVIVRAEVFPPQPQPQVPREPSRSIAGAGGVAGLPEILLFVQDRDGELRIVRPGPTVHVVRADQGHDVIDDHTFGVDVDGVPLLVL